MRNRSLIEISYLWYYISTLINTFYIVLLSLIYAVNNRSSVFYYVHTSGSIFWSIISYNYSILYSGYIIFKISLIGIFI